MHLWFIMCNNRTTDPPHWAEEVGCKVSHTWVGGKARRGWWSVKVEDWPQNCFKSTNSRQFRHIMPHPRNSSKSSKPIHRKSICSKTHTVDTLKPSSLIHKSQRTITQPLQRPRWHPTQLQNTKTKQKRQKRAQAPSLPSRVSIQPQIYEQSSSPPWTTPKLHVSGLQRTHS